MNCQQTDGMYPLLLLYCNTLRLWWRGDIPTVFDLENTANNLSYFCIFWHCIYFWL